MSISRSFALIIMATALFAVGCKTDTQVVAQSEAPPTSAASDTEPTATAAPEPEPTAAPAPTATTQPEPTAEDSPEGNSGRELADIAPEFFSSKGFGGDLDSDQLTCAIQRLAAEPDLLGRVLESADPLTMSIEDQADLAIIAFDCAPDAFAAEFVDGFNEGSEVPIPLHVTECLVEAMGSDGVNRRDVVLGFAALGTNNAVPVGAQDAVIETMVTCLPGNVFADAVIAEALSDPGLAAALDLECLDTAFDGEVMRPLWSALVMNPAADFDSLPPAATGPMLEAMFSCVSFGRIIAASAAQDGVILSESSIGCIDEELVGFDILAAISADSPPREFQDALTDCLTPEELEAIGGL